MQVAHCKPIVDWWNNREEIVDAESGDEKSRRFSAQELLDLGLNFDQCKFPKEEEEVLRPEELLKQYHEKRTALDAKIDQTLTEIQQILGIAPIASIEPIATIDTIAPIETIEKDSNHGK
jgi:type I restriction enzyme M protein